MLPSYGGARRDTSTPAGVLLTASSAPENSHSLVSTAIEYAARSRRHAPSRRRSATGPARASTASWTLGRGVRARRRGAPPLDLQVVLEALARDLLTDVGAEARLVGGSSISAETVLAIASVDLAAADRDTLANVTTSNETAARLASELVGRSKPYSTRVAQRARLVLIRLGWQVVIERGRRMRLEECQEAREAHGQQQTMAASTRDWIIPGESVVTQPSVGASSTSHALEVVTKRADARSAAMTTKTSRPSACRETPRPIAAQRLAAHLVRDLPILGRDITHIGSVVKAVLAAGIDAERWTSRDLIEAMTVVNQQLGRDALPGGLMRDPLAWFVSVARFAVRYAEISGWESPSVRARRITEESRRLRAKQEAARRAEAERVASIDQDEVAAAIAEMHRLFPTPVTSRRRAHPRL